MTSTRQLQELVLLRRALADGTARRLRTDAGLSLSDVARYAGVTPATVSRWETGTHVPRVDQGLRYAAVLKALQAVPNETA